MTTTPTASPAEVLRDEVNALLPHWSDDDLDLAEAQEWTEVGEDKFVVAKWLAHRVRVPQGRPDGLSPRDCTALDRLDGHDPSMQWRTPTPETPGWAGVADCCPRAISVLGPQPGGPAAVVALVRLLTDIATGGKPHVSYSHGRCEPEACAAPGMARRVRDAALNVHDITTCLSAGLSFEEAVAHVSAGRDMAPVRVMAGLA